MAGNVAAVLAAQIARVQRQNPAYSLRALARDLGLAPSYVSEVLSGKRPFPRKRLPAFTRALRMDELARRQLEDALARELLARAGIRKTPRPAARRLSGAAEMPARTFTLLEKWYYLAILDLAACQGARMEPDYVARRLGITKWEAERALERLRREKWLVKADGQWKKSPGDLRFPTTESRELVRGFHRQMMEQGIKELSRASPERFAQRLLSGVTLSGNPANLERAKARLHEALYEVAEILAEGECSAVFQLSTQMFPLTQ